MAQSQEVGNSTVTADKLSDLLAAPLSPDWIIERLAEQLLCAIASQPKGETKNVQFDLSCAADRQSQRILRPLLAFLATKSATEAGTQPDLYGGQLCFKRNGPDGPVWILGEFENKPGTQRVELRQSFSAPVFPEQRTSHPSVSPAEARTGR